MYILVVDDDEVERSSLAAAIGAAAGVRVDTAASGPAALDRMAAHHYDGVITALAMQPMDGIELVRRIRRAQPQLPVLVLTADATVDRAIDAMRAGATDFLPKPVSAAAIVDLVRRDSGRAHRAAGMPASAAARGLFDSAATEASTAAPRGTMPARATATPPRDVRAGSQRASDYIAGTHLLLDGVRNFAERVARVPEARVLITGDSGTGKSHLARAIHELAGGDGRFVEVNCATLPPSLMESELFGHERGAFTDAKALKRGLVELATGGTLFLDEIGALPLDMQTKLLVFLEVRQIRRVGGNDPIPANARVIAATSEDLREAVRAGRFREDLLYRLDVASIRMPSLHAMPAVITELAVRFTQELAAQFRRTAPALSDDSLQRLQEYVWPGNARELRNALERALIFHDDGPLDVHPPEPAASALPADGLVLPRGLTLDEVERLYILDAMHHNDGDLTSLAARLGISRKTLWEKRRRFDS
jgi:two-component system, NtrC family, response regulator HydG